MSIAVNPDEPFHVVHQGNVIAVSLDQLATAYQEDQVADETLIWQEGFEEWIRLDTLLHTLEQQEGPVAAPPELAEDIFYVMVAPDEVKQMSLDLLADAYRLEVIDDDTLVWQPSFTEWLPISALLGPEDAHVSIAPSMPPAYNGGYASAAPVAPMSQEAPVPNFNSGTLNSGTPTSGSLNAGNFNSGTLNSGTMNTYRSLNTLDDSLAPAADWSIIPQHRKASPWYGRSLVALAAAGAFFVIYRAGAMESGAEGPAPGSLLAQLESKVGAPGVDTTQGLDRWLAQLEETHGLSTLSETDPISSTTSPAKSEEPAAGEQPKAAEAPVAATDTTAPAKTEAEQAPKKTENSAAASFSSSLSGAPKKSATASAPARRQAQPAKSSSGTKWKGPAGSAYDPMNGAL